MRCQIVMLLLSGHCFCSLSSCGYHLSGTGGIVPEGARTIAIPVFINGTKEPYVDVEVTQAVVEEFLTDGRLKVVSPEEAELVLQWQGDQIRGDRRSSYHGRSYVQQYKVQSSPWMQVSRT